MAAAVPPERCVWAYPIVGAVLGGLGALVFVAARGLGLPAPLATVWTVATALLLTGALHEDGLADTADGFGGGRSQERKLEIMRDSRIGTYGALALVISVGVRATTMASLPSSGAVAAALIVAGSLGRGGIVGVVALLPPARPDGLGAALRHTSAARLTAGLAIATASCALLPMRPAIAALATAAIATVAVAACARRQIGGYSGDVLGAAEQVTECAVLSALAAFAAG